MKTSVTGLLVCLLAISATARFIVGNIESDRVKISGGWEILGNGWTNTTTGSGFTVDSSGVLAVAAISLNGGDA